MKILKSIFVMVLITNQISCGGPDKERGNANGQGPGNSLDEIVLSEFVFQADDVPFPSCHASTIVETENGLLVSWFGGTREKDPDVGIWLSRLSNGEWTIPVEVANGVQPGNKRYPTWNPVLFNTGSGIMLFYKVGPSPQEWWGEVITSVDKGINWSAPVRLPENIFGPIKNKPVELSGGILLSPSSTEDMGWRVHMEISQDMGTSWERTGALNDGKEIAVIQPSILVHADRKVQLLCRSKNNVIFSSWSSDKGHTWSKFEDTGLPNPNSGFDAVTLNDGKHILVYNHIACEPGNKWGDRNILNMAVSADGMHWKAAILLENDEDKDAEYSYPAVIQASDGNLHITYTWNRKLIKHVVVDPSKIKAVDMIDGNWPSE